jgi:hypothetical protein
MEGACIRHPSTNESRRWLMCGHKIPKDEITFFLQIILIYIVVITCLVNLTIGVQHTNIWIALVSGCVGYILPSPKIKKKNKPNGAILFESPI